MKRPASFALALVLLTSACAFGGLDGDVRIQSERVGETAVLEVPDPPEPGPDHLVAWRSEKHTVQAGGVVWGRRDGAPAAFPRKCAYRTRGCEPLWTAGPSGTRIRVLDVSGGFMFGTTDHGIVGYPVHCRKDGGRCAPQLMAGLFDPHRNQPYGSEVRMSFPVVSRRAGRWFLTVVERPTGGKIGQYRIYALSLNCEPECDLLWRTPLLQESFVDPVAVGRSLLAVGEHGLLAFGMHCRSDGGVCTSLTRYKTLDLTGQTVHAPIVAGDRIVLGTTHGNYSGDQSPATLYVFPRHCGERVCEPLWTFSRPGFALSAFQRHRDRIYVGTFDFSGGSEGVFGFDLRCDKRCKPAWRTQPRSYGWLLGFRGGLAYVGEGAQFGAFPLDCETRRTRGCDPVWTTPTKTQAGGLVFRDDTFYLTDRRTLYAFPTTCGASCLPRWTWTGTRFLGEPKPFGELILVREGFLRSSEIVAIDPSRVR